MKVLISAYACEPGKGSEPGLGWNVVREMARYHEVSVLTRVNNRPAIEAALAEDPVPSLQFVFYDLPAWARWWKKGQRGVQLYYYLWQVGAYLAGRRWHEQVGFDLVHHVTFAKYWAPSFLSLLPVPFLWGPVGGGESAPQSFKTSFGARGRVYDNARAIARWLGEYDPFVRKTARRSVYALATTEDTAARLRIIGCRNVEILSQVALPDCEIATLGQMPPAPEGPMRFVSIGNLLHLKGFDLGIRAFAQMKFRNTEYWIIGDGPERDRLQALARSLNVDDRIRFFGALPRSETLQQLQYPHVLVHPTLHDSGGWVCAEAMAAGRPVICLDLGGPAMQVTSETGFTIPAANPDQAVRDIASAMERLASDRELLRSMSLASKAHAAREFTWSHKAKAIHGLYQGIIEGST